MRIEEEERLKRGVIDWAYALSHISDNIERTTNYLLRCENVDKKDYLYKSDREFLEKEFRNLRVLIWLMSDKNNAAKIEALSKEMATWSNENVEVPHWDEVAGCLLKDPTSIVFDYGVCPECGGKTFKCYFLTAGYIRSMGLGVGGNMIVCPHCHHRDWLDKIHFG